MNVIHRSVLKQHSDKLADIILTDTLLGEMHRTQIFERNMIDLIKAEKTEGDKTCKLLELLPKRGPHAFDSFMEVIQKDYPWLVTKLLTDSIKQETSSKAPTKPDLKLDNDSACTSMAIDADMDIKTKVSTFLHKQFGHSRRISESDKKTMIRWMSQTVQNERNRSSGKLLESISMTTEDKCCGTDEDHGEESAVDHGDKIQQLYQKLQEFKRDHQKKSIPRSENNPSRDSQSQSPKSASQISGYLDSMITDVQHLMTKLEEMDSEVNKCYLILGDHAKCLSLSLLISEKSISTKQKEEELRQEKQKTEKMLIDLYEYSKQVLQLEQAKAQQEILSVSHTEEVSNLQRRLEESKQHIVKLEHLNKLHMEKQRTIENLKSLVKDLQNDNGTMSRPTRVTTVGSRQAPRYGTSRTKTDGEKGSLQKGVKKNLMYNLYKKKTNPSTFRY